MLTHHAFRSAALFAVAGLLSRSTFRHFETRWQIVIFVVLICLYQLVLRPAFDRQASIASLALDCGAATVAIIATKVIIEWPLIH